MKTDISGLVHTGSFIPTVRPTVHINSSLKQTFFEKTLETGRILKFWLCVSARTEITLKTQLFKKHDDVRLHSFFIRIYFIRISRLKFAKC